MTLATPRQKYSRRIQLVFPILVWLAIFSFPLAFQGPAFRLPLFLTLRYLLIASLLCGLYYLNVHVLIPRLLFQRKVLVYSLALVGCVVVILAADFLLHYFLMDHPQLGMQRPNFPNTNGMGGNALPPRPEFNRGRPPAGPFFRIPTFRLYPFFASLVVLSVSTSLMTIRKWLRDEEKQDQLEKENLASELAFLKTQINPHFFFNTLNNISVLTELDPALAQKAIHQLSRMMRYVLYETEKSQVTLQQEIDFLRHYIDLMRLRLTDDVTVEFTFQMQNGQLLLAPLLFIPLVENAFKHGVSYQQPCNIRIELTQDQNAIVFRTLNRVFRREDPLEDRSGIGLSNVRRRLNLLYPERHTFQMEEVNSQFAVEIKLFL
ncbi:Histidine kinase [Catalinimonas alkaloidigena]|uniref:Histidine kinase n=1 Tax=Catalinimonas alkaloidigena TaxID=1075417 RepID=A0A1G9HGQ5_9BACT|nr:histidine kinase [Catalinimonas alkaloidigena]SDL12095.1 Histidine kinase [Catalinimonas alkaloidigena]